MKVHITFLALTILLSFTVNHIKATASNPFGDNFFQSIWYIEMDETQSPVRHRFGMKNFENNRERSFFTNTHIHQRTPYFRLRIDRDTTLDNFSWVYNPDTISKFDKQFHQYFPKINFADPRGGYYVLEDESNCTTESYNINTFCETKFWITYYRNFKLARLAYEKVISDAVSAGNAATLLLAFGGPSGFLDATDWDYFMQKYLTYWCPYKFGIYSHFSLNSNDLDNKKHIYLRDDQTLGVAPETDPVFLPYLINDTSGVTDECDIRESATTSGYTYVPSEFQTNCISRTFTPSTLTLLNTSRILKSYMACWNNNVNDTTPIFYNYHGICKLGNRKFLIIKPATVEAANFNVSFDISCLNTNSGVTQTLTISQLFSGMRSNQSIDLSTEFDNSLSQDCAYTNSTTKNSCNSHTVSCAVNSITPDYLDFVLTLTGTNTDTPTAETTDGTVAMRYTLSIRLNLPISITN